MPMLVPKKEYLDTIFERMQEVALKRITFTSLVIFTHVHVVTRDWK